ncbi:hypothetical protein KDH_33310 [Dictyobacter sp. S3.2.2.5]|uniref:Uncharacterized protein n=1 Tax=Dictyobacter halimunensis TaxID=3026934 RepID=A0ABQ6FRW3_9CHLR|nr:hypothetical protein KDH_33310 [Dictyobacter sp. S3.2.2.5]
MLRQWHVQIQAHDLRSKKDRQSRIHAWGEPMRPTHRRALETENRGLVATPMLIGIARVSSEYHPLAQEQVLSV